MGENCVPLSNIMIRQKMPPQIGDDAALAAAAAREEPVGIYFIWVPAVLSCGCFFSDAACRVVRKLNLSLLSHRRSLHGRYLWCPWDESGYTTFLRRWSVSCIASSTIRL